MSKVYFILDKQYFLEKNEDLRNIGHKLEYLLFQQVTLSIF